jgi:hypothetical protein
MSSDPVAALNTWRAPHAAMCPPQFPTLNVAFADEPDESATHALTVYPLLGQRPIQCTIFVSRSLIVYHTFCNVHLKHSGKPSQDNTAGVSSRPSSELASPLDRRKASRYPPIPHRTRSSFPPPPISLSWQQPPA